MYGPCNKCEYCRDDYGKSFFQVTKDYLESKDTIENLSKKENTEHEILLRSVLPDFNEDAILKCKRLLQQFNSRYIFNYEKTGYKNFDQMVEYVQAKDFEAAKEAYDAFLELDMPRIFEYARRESMPLKPRLFCRRQISIASEGMFPKLKIEEVEDGSLGCGQFKECEPEVLTE